MNLKLEPHHMCNDQPLSQPPSKLPAYIDLDKWQDLGFTWAGRVVPTQFQRLAELVHAEHMYTPIELSCQLITQRQLLTLTLLFDGEVWVTCQRCLEPLAIEIEHDVALPLVAEDNQLSLLSDDDDYLMLDEVLETNQNERWLPLARLIEDELLLAVPLSAKHDDCQMAVTQVGEIEEEEPDNPFAQLASLKGKL